MGTLDNFEILFLRPNLASTPTLLKIIKIDPFVSQDQRRKSTSLSWRQEGLSIYKGQIKLFKWSKESWIFLSTLRIPSHTSTREYISEVRPSKNHSEIIGRFSSYTVNLFHSHNMMLTKMWLMFAATLFQNSLQASLVTSKFCSELPKPLNS